MPELGILGLGLGFSRSGDDDAGDDRSRLDGVREPEQPRRRHHHHNHHHHSRRKRRGGVRAKGVAFEAVEEEEGRKVTEELPRCQLEKPGTSSSNSITVKSSSGNNCSSSSNSPFFFVISSSAGLFSATPGSPPVSGDPCSFASDNDTHLPFHLAGRGRGGSGGGPDLDPEGRTSFDINAAHDSKEADQEVSREEVEGEAGEGAVLDPAKHSFSLALKECQSRRFRFEGHPFSTAARKQRRRRPASVDFNGPMSDASISSPRSLVAGGGIKKSSAASVHSRSGMFPSPGTPNYRNASSGAAGYQKGWSSERVPLPVSSGRRYGNSAAFLPYGNGRAMPSKWEDAEKWICSPVSTDGVSAKSSALPPHHRRPKSKSGPLGPPGIGGAYLSSSPLIPGFDGGRTQNFTGSSPFMEGVLVADRSCCGGGGSNGRGGGSAGSGGGESRSYSAQSDHCILRSASVHGWSELLMESSSSLQSSQDEKLDNMKNCVTELPQPALRKDMATQMSPEGSTHSSPKGKLESSSPPPSRTIGELRSHFSRLEVRDVQVDDQITVTRWSKKHIARGLDKNSSNFIQWKRKTVDARSEAWEVAETAKCMSKMKREEARITAWENLQKAKAEAAIRKLEMKLEKKRSSSMDKILNKLRSAQRKAQEMHNAVTASQAQQVAATRKTLSFRKSGQIGSLSGCFTCHAF